VRRRWTPLIGLALAGAGVWWWQGKPTVDELQRRVRGTPQTGTTPVVVRSATPPVPAEATRSGLTVQGLVVNGAGNPEAGVEVRGCDRLTTSDAEGRFTLVVAAGECRLHAQRVDGALPTEGPREDVRGVAGETVRVLLTLPEYPQGFAGVFLGIGVQANRVASVAPGSVAASEGVEPGHVVLSIDGQDTAGLDAEALWGAIQGDAGTDVALELETTGGAIYDVVLPREVVGR